MIIPTECNIGQDKIMNYDVIEVKGTVTELYSKYRPIYSKTDFILYRKSEEFFVCLSFYSFQLLYT